MRKKERDIVLQEKTPQDNKHYLSQPGVSILIGIGIASALERYPAYPGSVRPTGNERADWNPELLIARLTSREIASAPMLFPNDYYESNFVLTRFFFCNLCFEKHFFFKAKEKGLK